MSAVHWLPWIAAVFAWAGAPAGAASTASPPWWNRAWKYRKIVRIAFPKQGRDLPVDPFAPSRRLGTRLLTGKAVFTVESDRSPSRSGGVLAARIRRPGREVVVTDADGLVLPATAFAGWDDRVTVYFRARAKTADYYIYYGNPKANRPRVRLRRSRFPVLMVTVPVRDPAAMNTPTAAVRAVLDAERDLGKIGTYTINSTENPFRLEPGTYYLSLYSGLMYAAEAGTYWFALDLGGRAHLLIDGSLLLSARGGAGPVSRWKHKAAVKLRRGVHTFVLLHGERTGTEGIRIGWRPPGRRTFSLMNWATFAQGNCIPAEVVGFEERDKPVTPFFTVRRWNVAFRVPGSKKAMVPVELRNRTRGDGLAWRWNVGGKVFHERSPFCSLEAGRDRRIVLEVFRNGTSQGTYTRTVPLGALRHVRAEVASELIACPSVVYEDEPAKVTFRITNLSDVPLPLRCVRTVAGAAPVSRCVEVAAREEKPLDLPLPRPAPDSGSLGVTFQLWLTDAKLAEETLRVLRPGPHLARLKSRLGHLVDGKGRRVVIVVKPENEADYRRWAVLKWLGHWFRRGPKKILLFGDPMRNVVAGDDAPYVRVLKSRLRAAGKTLTFVESSTEAVVPCLADIPAFAAALEQHAPDLVVLSPGSRDALRGTGRRRFARCLDVLIDVIRSQDDPPRVVLVSPPPLLGNLRQSHALARAARLIARQHHVPFVDLHARLTAPADWKQYYKQDADDRVYSLYPNLDAQKGIADAILDAVR